MPRPIRRSVADLRDLPDDAPLFINDVIALTGRSRPSVGRDVEAGALPKPRKAPGKDPSRAARYWLAGEIRAALRKGADAVPSDFPVPYCPAKAQAGIRARESSQ